MIRDLLNGVMEQKPVMAPMERKDQPGFIHFDFLSAPDDLVTDYVTTTLPPKKAFFQPSEPLFTFTMGDRPDLDLISDVTRFVLAGVHPCDLAGLEALDKAYSHPPPEARWAADRKLAVVIGLDCMPDEYCFCESMGSIQSRYGCDLFLTPIERGFLTEIHTEAGKDLTEMISVLPASEQDISHWRHWRSMKSSALTASLDEPVERLAQVLADSDLTAVWQDTADRCYGCGSCNITCPTCFCFDMHDELNLSLDSGLRRRTWDSCQLLEFSMVAGRHNFRADRQGRVRHRWKRKFMYLYQRLGIPYCVGCGRCSRACTADINIVDVTNSILTVARESAHHE